MVAWIVAQGVFNWKLPDIWLLS